MRLAALVWLGLAALAADAEAKKATHKPSSRAPVPSPIAVRAHDI